MKVSRRAASLEGEPVRKPDAKTTQILAANDNAVPAPAVTIRFAAEDSPEALRQLADLLARLIGTR